MSFVNRDMRMKPQSKILQKSWTLIIYALDMTSVCLIDDIFHDIKSVILSGIMFLFPARVVSNYNHCKCKSIIDIGLRIIAGCQEKISDINSDIISGIKIPALLREKIFFAFHGEISSKT